MDPELGFYQVTGSPAPLSPGAGPGLASRSECEEKPAHSTVATPPHCDESGGNLSQTHGLNFLSDTRGGGGGIQSQREQQPELRQEDTRQRPCSREGLSEAQTGPEQLALLVPCESEQGLL